MKLWKLIAVGAAVVAAPFVPSVLRSRPVTPGATPEAIRPGQSAALFVGVRKFEHKDTVEVPYAVDDAVDLAYLFALDRRVSLVPPARVVLALSGQPQKVESRERLKQLKSAGARVETAEQSDILTLLEEQAALAGRDGLLIVSIATHGFMHDGAPHVLGSKSRFDYRETALPAARLFDIAARAKRSLIFVDACRERMALGSRSVRPEPATAAPLLEKMERVDGQVVFYAAAAGGYAFDDDRHRNGVFTRAILDGLRCGASSTRDVVTVAELHTHVERQVRDWIRAHRDPSVESATQISMDGRTDLMPLAQCPPPPLEDPILQVRHGGTLVTALTADDQPVWTSDAGGEVLETSVVDLDADGNSEVIAATARKLIALDRNGKPLWSADEGMTLVTFATGQVAHRSTRQVVSLWSDRRSSRLVYYDAAGTRLGAHDHASALQSVMFYRPTNRHNPRVVAAGTNEVVLFDKRKPSWTHTFRSTPRDLEIVDCNDDGRKDIAVVTGADRSCLSLEGRVLPH